MIWSKEWPKSIAGLEEAAAHGWSKPTDSAAIDWAKGNDTTAAVIIKDNKIIDVKYGEETEKLLADNEQVWPTVEKLSDEAAAEMNKAWADASLHGTGFIQDRKHVPLAEVYINQERKLFFAKSTTFETAEITEWPKGQNQIPTHDTYTNPGAYLYYECNCGQRLDPHTKRFAELNNYAMKEGWKIRWGANSYVPYCVKCGRDVE